MVEEHGWRGVAVGPVGVRRDSAAAVLVLGLLALHAAVATVAPVAGTVLAGLGAFLAAGWVRRAAVSRLERAAWLAYGLAALVAFVPVAALPMAPAALDLTRAAAFAIGAVCCLIGQSPRSRRRLAALDAVVAAGGAWIALAVVQRGTLGAPAAWLGTAAAALLLARAGEAPRRLASLLLAAGATATVVASEGFAGWSAAPAAAVALAAVAREHRFGDRLPKLPIAPLLGAGLGFGASLVAPWVLPVPAVAAVLTAFATVAGLALIRLSVGAARSGRLAGIRRTRAELVACREANHVARDALLLIDAHGDVRYAAGAVPELLGSAAAGLTGAKLARALPTAEGARLHAWLGQVHTGVETRFHARWTVEPAAGAPDGAAGPRVLDLELLAQRARGGTYPARVTDVTAEAALTDQARASGLTDPATGLATRAALLDRMATARERRDTQFSAVLSLALHGLARGRATLGDDAADAALGVVGEVLRGLTAAGDTVARSGDETFAIRIAGPVELPGALERAQDLTALFRKPLPAGEQWLCLRASVGVATPDLAGDEPARLLAAAELARASTAGGGVAVFGPELAAAAARRLALETALHGAVERGELVLWYEPVVALATGRVVGVEASARWQHPDFGVIPEAELEAVTASTGLARSIGGWLLRESALQLKRWVSIHRATSRLWVTLRLAPEQLADHDLAVSVAEAARAADIVSSRFILKLPDGLLLHDAPATLTRLARLKAVGARLAIGDFGMRSAAPGELRRVSVDHVALDGELLRKVGRDEADTALVRALVAAAEALHCTTVATGIERPEQARYLDRIGCQLGQGAAYHDPMPARAFGRLLREWRELSGDDRDDIAGVSAGGVVGI